MKIALSTAAPTEAEVDLLAVGVHAGKVGKDAKLRRIDKAMGGALARQAKDEDFTGKRAEVLKVPGSGSLKAKWVVVVGLGDGDPSPSDARLLAVTAARTVKQQRSLGIVLPMDEPETARAAAEGVVTGAYKYTQYLTGDRKPKGGLKTVDVLAEHDEDELLDGLGEGEIVGEMVNVCRDLVNAPPNDLNPPALADFARKQARAHGVTCKVWDKARLQKEGMNLFLAVNAGSGIEPRFIHMTHKPTGVRNPPKVVLVGKGITFDAGGLCLKPPKAMLDMKCDMGGAAVTLAVTIAAARLDLPIEVHGLIGATENMTGDFAYRPGDVFKSLEGKTVEIINTDAEGRLVLADVLAYAQRLKPTYMVDHATLTGACMVALGQWTAGLFANDEDLAELYEQSAEDMDESFWRLPLTDELVEGLKSDVADLKHMGEPHGGAITAALFLREFVGKTKWAHVDIAGPAHVDRPNRLMPKGGTGFGVSTAVRFLEQLCE